MKIQLSPTDVKRFTRPIRGRGGFQTFLRKIAKQLSGSGELTISNADLEKMVRYSFKYGQGGFQARTRKTASKIG